MSRPARVSAEAAGEALRPVGATVDLLLDRFLAERVAELTALDPALGPVAEEVRGFVLAGGKRLRPAFVYWGHRAAGAGHDDEILVLAAAVELLHSFALIHDDVMDRSAVRRGRATVHEALAARHRDDGLHGDPGWFGTSAAILAGDLAFVWADQLFEQAEFPASALSRARQVFTALRTEVMAGQYLDLRLAGSPEVAPDDPVHVALLKSGRYTVTRPLQMGAAVAPSCDGLVGAALDAFGDAVGVAFQLRDDVLGMFGDPRATGKSAVGDLREGKRTLLVVQALGRGSPAQRAALASMLGSDEVDEEDAERAREIIVDTGALAAVELALAERRQVATAAVAPVPSPAREALEELADLAAFRAL